MFEDRINFVNLNISSTALESEFQKTEIDSIIHFAGSIVVSESVVEPIKYYENNISNTLNLIKLATKYNVKNFIFSSSAAVYGDAKAEDIPIKESSTKSPINPYGETKLITEWILNDVCRNSKMKFVALRYFNVAGASSFNTKENLARGIGLGQRSKNATLLIKVASEVAVGKREKMFIYGDDYPTTDGTCIRDYIHVDDLANAHISAIKYLDDGGESTSMNVGYGHGYSVKEVIEMVKKVSGVDFKVEIAPRRLGDPAELISDPSLIKSRTSFAPRFDNLEFICRSSYEFELMLKNFK